MSLDWRSAGSPYSVTDNAGPLNAIDSMPSGASRPRTRRSEETSARFRAAAPRRPRPPRIGGRRPHRPGARREAEQRMRRCRVAYALPVGHRGGEPLDLIGVHLARREHTRGSARCLHRSREHHAAGGPPRAAADRTPADTSANAKARDVRDRWRNRTARAGGRHRPALS